MRNFSSCDGNPVSLIELGVNDGIRDTCFIFIAQENKTARCARTLPRNDCASYAREPFPSNVVRVFEAFGLDPGIVRPSKLLSGHEELLDRLVL
jgi:hypothetical protein